MGASSSSSSVAVENLFPAIIQCFFIIFVGYICGRTRIVSPTESKGIGHYVSYIALPSLLFKAMVELDFSSVNWILWMSILISKSIVFILVFVFTTMLGRPVQLGTAGIYSIFATQSNDFALGYPIIKALYAKTHPEFVNYLYLFAPISLAILNPIGFIFLEIQRSRSMDAEDQQAAWKVAWNVTKRSIANPVLIVVFVGVIFNYIFQGAVPIFIKDILKLLGDSFNATALFYLGLGLVGTSHRQAKFVLVVPAILIAAKSIFLPLLTRAIISGMNAGDTANATEALSTFGFIYGTFPTAPTVYVYATLFNSNQALIATGLLVGTFLSAPLMFISATMEALPVNNPAEYESLVAEASLYISIIGIGCCIWVLGIFLISRRSTWIPHNFTVNLVLAQLVACIGVILYRFCDDRKPWQHYIQFIAFLLGVLGSRCWTSMIALALCLLRCKSMCFVLRYKGFFYVYGWGMTSICVAILLVVSTSQDKIEVDPVFQYGNLQVVMSIVILISNIVIVTASLVILQRNDRFQNNEYLRVSGVDSGIDNDNTVGLMEDEDEEEDQSDSRNRGSGDADILCTENGAVNVVDIENISENTCKHISRCTEHKQRKCRMMLNKYESRANELSMENDEILSALQRHQLVRHIVLLLLLLLSMFIGLFLCMWRLFNDSKSGIYVELEFLDSVFSFGQSFFVLACFGFDTQYVIMPFMKKWRKFWYGVEHVQLPEKRDLDQETKFTCEQFNMYHKDRCKQELVHDLRYHLRVYKGVFRGSAFVDWLLEVGLAKDRSDAGKYGNRLLLGRVIEHVKQEHHFHDRSYFYRFVKLDEYE
ncbi:lysosomal cholesterol signaling protein-like [Saccoglossus kowalevskii]